MTDRYYQHLLDLWVCSRFDRILIRTIRVLQAYQNVADAVERGLTK